MTDGFNQESQNSEEGLNVSEDLATLAGIVILAGGASKRMGSPKVQLMLPTNETLLDYHVRQSMALNVPIMIADNGRGFLVDKTLLGTDPKPPIFHILDYGATTEYHVPHTGGALVAIESALQRLMNRHQSATPKLSSWLLVISCDSLIPASKLWQKLQPAIANASDTSVICLTDEAHLYPLLGIYRLSVEPRLRVYLDRGERRVMPFIETIMQTVPVPKSWQDVTNFNTPDEFKRAYTSWCH